MPASLVPILVEFAVKYGIPAALKVIAELKKPEPTVEAIEEIFKGVLPYEAYGIPDIAPTKPV